MLRFAKKYRSYLMSEARTAKPNYRSRIQRLSAPWVIPSAAAAIICWWFDLIGTETLYVSIPLLSITIGGMIYVFWIVMKYGFVADYKSAKQKEVG